jgi:hypothetical protein
LCGGGERERERQFMAHDHANSYIIIFYVMENMFIGFLCFHYVFGRILYFPLQNDNISCLLLLFFFTGLYLQTDFQPIEQPLFCGILKSCVF